MRQDIPSLFDYAESMRLREEGMQRAEQNAHRENPHAHTLAAQWCRKNQGRTIIAEDIRIALLQEGFCYKSDKAYGALTTWLLNHGFIEGVDGWGRMTAKSSHGRKTPKYRVVTQQ